MNMRNNVERLHADYLKREQVVEIYEVRKALIRQGSHPHVTPAVARWFRLKGFIAEPDSLRQRGYWTVEVNPKNLKVRT